MTSTPATPIDLESLTSRPLVQDSTLDLHGVDLLSIVVLPANYGCGACSRRARTFVEALRNHPSFESLSTKTSAVIAEPDHRVATHFARMQQLGTPVFQTPTAPVKSENEETTPCSALLINPQTERAFFKVHLARASVTEDSDAVFKAARAAYQRHVQ